MPSNKSGSVYIENRTGSSEDTGDDFFSKNDASKLEELERRAKTVIFEAHAHRPLLSKNRDAITICLNRVTITKGGSFAGQEYPMAIENITTARVSKNFMFSSLDVDTFGVKKPEPVEYLKDDEARLARRYILALIDCKKSDVDLSVFDIDELRRKLKRIGMVYHGTTQ